MLPQFTKICMQIFKICVAEWAYILKIVNESHSVKLMNAKSLLALVRKIGLVYLHVPGTDCVRNNKLNLDP